MTEPSASEPYEGPAGVLFTPAELISIYVLLVGSNRPDYIAIRSKISRYLEQRTDKANRGDNR